MKLFGLIGNPTGHSLSPLMMRAAFSQMGYPGEYVRMDVGASQLEAAIRGLAALNFMGVNVTIPHKESVMRHVDELTEEAKAAGAVNTVKFEGGQIIGHNTDADGWWTGVQGAFVSPPKSAVILGHGGGARAVLYALNKNLPDCKVTVLGRDVSRVTQFAQQLTLASGVDVGPWESRETVIPSADLVVNATPIGMWPNVADSPVPEKTWFRTCQVVQDLVYRPLETRFLSLARQRGATTVDGLGMLVHQGALALEFWTNLCVPKDCMREALVAYIKQS